jgi:23S rRNA (cytosine1962-C5)-methyltransferase
MSAATCERPNLTLTPGGAKRLRQGSPWVYSNEIAMDAAAKALEPGALVELQATGGAVLGTAFFNRHALIAARLLDERPGRAVDVDFFVARLRRARDLRELVIPAPFYRLVHAEADGLPGLVVDRFDEAFVIQANTAGMERLTPLLLEALEAVFSPRIIVLRNDSAAREPEGLKSEVRLAKGTLDGPVRLIENGATFLADLRAGQKTGWFYDQRDNRAWTAGLAADRRVLDCFSYSGGFALQAALAGATKVTLLDRSEQALELARQAAEANGVAEHCRFNRADGFNRLEQLGGREECFDLVICDPPAFVKSRKDLQRGARAYRKLARLAANTLAPGGILVICSCSHHVDAAHFLQQVARGLTDAGRQGRVIHQGGAGPDHPLHPALPESGYLKAFFILLD